MANKINVDTRQLHTDLATIQECLDKSDSDQKIIKNDYEQLIKEWKGPAADSFDEKFNCSNENVKSMYKDLQAKVSTLLDICELFDSCEEEVINLIK